MLMCHNNIYGILGRGVIYPFDKFRSRWIIICMRFTCLQANGNTTCPLLNSILFGRVDFQKYSTCQIQHC